MSRFDTSRNHSAIDYNKRMRIILHPSGNGPDAASADNTPSGPADPIELPINVAPEEQNFPEQSEPLE
jgi:hypothetical protein